MEFEQEEQSGAGLAQLGRALRRRWKLGVTTLFVVLVVGVAISLLLPSKYRSSATILIEQQEIPQDFVRSMITSFASQRIELISQQVMTTTNLLDIIQRYDLYTDDRQRKPREVIIERMRENVGMNMISADVVDPQSGRPMQATIAFQVSFTDRRGRTAQRVANELTTLYLNRNLEQRAAKASETAAFLKVEADRLAAEIAEQEALLAEFKQQNMDSLPELAQFNYSTLDRTELELREVQRQKSVIDERRIYLESELSQVNPYSDLYTDTGQRILSPADRIKALSSEIASLKGIYGERHPALQRRQKELDALRETTGHTAAELETLQSERYARSRELEELRTTYTDDHPAVVRLTKQVAGLDEQIAAVDTADARDVASPAIEPENPAYIQLRAQLEAALAERESLEQRETQLRAKVEVLDQRLAATPQIERSYKEFLRQIDNARLKFTEVRAKELEARLAENLEIGRQGERFTLIEPPLPPQKPVSPNRPMLLGVSLFVGIVVALGVVAVADTLDTSVRDRAGLESLLGAMPLGTVPQFVTIAERRQAKRLRIGASLGVTSAMLLTVVAVHHFYRPLDVLFFIVMRKVGI